MNQKNYSHILNIKVISKISNTVINDEPLLETIKSLFVKKERVFNGIKLIWKKIELKGINKHFDLGDLVLDTPFNIDGVLIQNVKYILNQIYIELYSEGLLKDQQLIFKIIKPVTKKIPLVDTVGVFEFE